MKLEFSGLISKKYSNISFYENLSNGSWVVPGRQDEANSLFSQFCECTYKFHIAVFTDLNISESNVSSTWKLLY